MSKQPLKVMLVEDHEVVREGLRMVLETTGDIMVVAEASTASDAVANAGKARPDVIVMDVRLLEGNGIEATREIRSLVPRTRILMLTSFQDDEALFASIMAGGPGSVLARPCSPPPSPTAFSTRSVGVRPSAGTRSWRG